MELTPYYFVVTVEAEDLDQAQQVMVERLNHDEDLRDAGVGEYDIRWALNSSPPSLSGLMPSMFPHLGEHEVSRGRLVRDLQDAGWWSVAEDVANGLDLEAILDRLNEMGEGEDSTAVRLVADTDANL